MEALNFTTRKGIIADMRLSNKTKQILTLIVGICLGSSVILAHNKYFDNADSNFNYNNSEESRDFIKPLQTPQWRAKAYTHIEYSKPYSIYMLNSFDDVKLANEDIKAGTLINIDKMHKVQVGDIIKYDLADKAFILVNGKLKSKKFIPIN